MVPFVSCETERTDDRERGVPHNENIMAVKGGYKHTTWIETVGNGGGGLVARSTAGGGPASPV
jgi:hypothetical protein